MGFQRWPGYRGTLQSAWDRMKEVARAEVLPRSPAPIVARDMHPKALDAARRNLAAAQLAADVRLEAGDARDVQPFAEGGFLCTNPPYGERLAGREDADREGRLGGDRARGRRGAAGTGAGHRALPPEDPRMASIRQKKLLGLYRGLAEATGRFRGWQAVFLSGSPLLEQAFGRPELSHKLWNGPLEVRLLRYRIPG
jgi:putative N6-adenine-specific DNA methylase